MGTAKGSVLERPPAPVSTVSDLLPAVSGMGEGGPVGAGCPRLASRPRGPRGQRPFGGLHRRNIRFGKKGGAGIGKTKRGKGSKVVAIADRNGFPVPIWTGSASPHEVRLVDATLDSRFTVQQPQRLIGHKAYDSDKLDDRIKAEWEIDIIVPHR